MSRYDERLPIVVWAGRHSRMTGYSYAAKSYVNALRSVGVRTVAFDTDLLEIVGPTPPASLRIRRKGGNVSLVPLDARTPMVVVYHERPDYFSRVDAEGRVRLLGYSVFETTSVPHTWHEPMLTMDGMWTASEFNRDTFREGGVPPFHVDVVPHCLDIRDYRPELPPLDLPDLGETVFLTVVSNFNRKDTGLLLRAYLRAFEGNDRVTLLVKTMNDISQRDFDAFVAQAIAPEFDLRDPSLPDVRFLPVRLSNERMVQLYNTCDVYVSTERGKGWDIPAMESMALGKCNVGIDWSANTEFMNDDNSVLIPAEDRLVDADPTLITNHPMYAGHRWPSIDERKVVDALRRVDADAALRQRIGVNARRYVEENLSLEAVGGLIVEKLSALESWHYRSRKPAKVIFSKRPMKLDKAERRPKKWSQLGRTRELARRVAACGEVPLSQPWRKLAAFDHAIAYWKAQRDNLLPCDFVDHLERGVRTDKVRRPIERWRCLAKAETAAKRFRQTYLVEPTPEEISSGRWGRARRKLWGKYGGFRSPGDEVERLRGLRDKYLGQRCFVIGNGPSLNKLDLSKLRHEYTFAANKIYLLYDRIDWRPTFYTAMDWEVTPDSADEINALTGSTFFFPERFRDLLREGEDVYWFRGSAVGKTMRTQFKTDISDGVPSRGSVLISAIELAYFLGFREIYLIGVDVSYRIKKSVKQSGPDRFGTGTKLYLESTVDDDPNHFDPRYFGKGARWHDPNTDEMKRMFRIMRKGIEHHGGTFRNATAGGELEELDRVDFDSLFEDRPAAVSERPIRVDGGALSFKRFEYGIDPFVAELDEETEHNGSNGANGARQNGSATRGLLHLTPEELARTGRKLRKLKRDPEAFFRDSRYPAVQLLRHLFN